MTESAAEKVARRIWANWLALSEMEPVLRQCLTVLDEFDTSSGRQPRFQYTRRAIRKVLGDYPCECPPP